MPVAARYGGAAPVMQAARRLHQPGGSSDVVARLYAGRLRGAYAPQVVVDGRVGAAGWIAVEFVRAADADGSTFLQIPASMLTLQPHVFAREVRYDALTDLIPVSTVCSYPFAFAVPKSSDADAVCRGVAPGDRGCGGHAGDGRCARSTGVCADCFRVSGGIRRPHPSGMR